MRTSMMNPQRGQAMTEFVAAMAMFIPLILGVIYVFKYGDIKHQAIQASRYAAMERALDPRRQAVANGRRAGDRLLVDGQAVAFGLRDLGSLVIEEEFVVEALRWPAAENPADLLRGNWSSGCQMHPRATRLP